jgi:acyl dehydratase
MYFDDFVEGDKLVARDWCPSHVQLFRFSAVTQNPHRIHYDLNYAHEEGYPDVLVQSHLHGSYLSNIVLAWSGPAGRLVRFGWENRKYVIVDETVTFSGTVNRVYVENERPLIDVEVEERNLQGELCVKAWATIQLPRRVQLETSGVDG